VTTTLNVLVASSARTVANTRRWVAPEDVARALAWNVADIVKDRPNDGVAVIVRLHLTTPPP